MKINELKEKVIRGESVSFEEAVLLSNTEDKLSLYKAAGEIRDQKCGKHFDTCSIVNARSGRCSENCKWCSQSVLFKTHVEEYDLIDEKTCLELALKNAEYGVDKFSFVTSGRALSDRNIDKLCEYALKIQRHTPMHLCASMGFLSSEQLHRLHEAGVTSYLPRTIFPVCAQLIRLPTK